MKAFYLLAFLLLISGQAFAQTDPNITVKEWPSGCTQKCERWYFVWEAYQAKDGKWMHAGSYDVSSKEAKNPAEARVIFNKFLKSKTPN